jgi:membrane fusion protein (multidrug efflux system)
LLVPQLAITHNQKGDPTALVVGPDSKVQLRTLTTERAIGDKWLINGGLAAGDRVIVEGLQFAKPGSTVKAEELEPQGAAPQDAPSQSPAAAAAGS